MSKELTVSLTQEEAILLRDLLPKEPLGAFYYDLVTKFDWVVKEHDKLSSQYYNK